ncbi:hypothetical protein, partial [Novosphingobium malaysiense]
SYDPRLATAALSQLGRLLDAAGTGRAWETVLGKEPLPLAEIPPERMEDVLAVFADFADLKEPRRAGFSRAVAHLAA